MPVRSADEVRARLVAGDRLAFDQDAPAGDRVVDVAWIIDAVRAGVEVDVENARIVGLLDLSEHVVRQDFRLLRCEICDFADFSYAAFERTLHIERCHFEAGASFDSARFRSDVWFDDTRFGLPRGDDQRSRAHLFNDADFAGVLSAHGIHFDAGVTVRFERAKFASLVNLARAVFDGPLDLNWARVAGDLLLSQAKWQGPFSLSAAEIGGVIDLSESRFARRASLTLSETSAARGFVMSRAVFLGVVVVDMARIAGVFGEGAVFGCGLHLTRSAVDGAIVIRNARFGRRYAVSLHQCSVTGDVDLGGSRIRGPLRLDESTLRRRLRLAGARLGRAASFVRLQVGSVDLARSRFESRFGHDAPDFTGAVSTGDFNADDVVLSSGLRMREARIGGALTLVGMRSSGAVDLFLTTIAGTLSLGAARIRASATALNLEGVGVGGIAWFDKARFSGTVSAIGIRVEMQMSCNDAIFLGDADFYELDVRRSVFMKGARFRRLLKLDRARINGEAYFGGARFRGRVTFDASTTTALRFETFDEQYPLAARFEGGVSMKHAKVGYLGFDGVVVAAAPTGEAQRAEVARTPAVTAVFGHCEFSSVASFRAARFEVPTSFYAATFGGEALFPQADFARGATFSVALFKARAVFNGVRFVEAADFSYARFEAAAIFRAWFGALARFDLARFGGSAEFSDPSTIEWVPRPEEFLEEGAELAGCRFDVASFVQSRFSGDARFDSVRFVGTLDLRQATFATLYLPDVADRNRQDELLPSGIGLVGCRYERVILRHPRSLLIRQQAGLRLMDGYDRQPFAQLEETLRRAGDDDEADHIYLAGRHAEARSKRALARLLVQTYGVLVNYGVRPWRLVIYATALIFAGAWFFTQPGTVALKAKGATEGAPYQAGWEEATTLSLAHFLPAPLAVKEQLGPAARPATVEFRVPGGTRAFTVSVRPSTVASVLQIFGWIVVPVGVAAMTGVLMRKKK